MSLSPHVASIPWRVPPSAEEAGDAPAIVLVVDDCANCRTATRFLLQSVGHEVIEAATGLEAMRLVADMAPSAILLDMVLPGLDGWEIARRLRSDPLTRETPIIAVTALSGSDDHDRALVAGCDAVLTKPVPPSTLLDVIRQHAGSAGRTRARFR